MNVWASNAHEPRQKRACVAALIWRRASGREDRGTWEARAAERGRERRGLTRVGIQRCLQRDDVRPVRER